ncbi:MAG: helix-turn-helix transcriptional regulator [Chloroflexi bacterium]|nr:helix-turn-helix transcriptional regulator [Chloroflexota bacterium]
METTANPTYDVETALRVLGGKWKVLIVWHLIEEPRRYGQLKRLIPGITEKMLIRQLRELEADGIIIRTDYHTVPPHVDYHLSEHGQSVLPILGALCEWGRLHIQR